MRFIVVLLSKPEFCDIMSVIVHFPYFKDKASNKKKKNMFLILFRVHTASHIKKTSSITLKFYYCNLSQKQNEKEHKVIYK